MFKNTAINRPWSSARRWNNLAERRDVIDTLEIRSHWAIARKTDGTYDVKKDGVVLCNCPKLRLAFLACG